MYDGEMWDISDFVVVECFSAILDHENDMIMEAVDNVISPIEIVFCFAGHPNTSHVVSSSSNMSPVIYQFITSSADFHCSLYVGGTVFSILANVRI